MSKDRTLDESLDEIEKWSENLVKGVEGLTPQQAAQYFKKSKARLERRTGRKLRIPSRRAPRSEKA